MIRISKNKRRFCIFIKGEEHQYIANMMENGSSVQFSKTPDNQLLITMHKQDVGPRGYDKGNGTISFEYAHGTITGKAKNTPAFGSMEPTSIIQNDSSIDFYLTYPLADPRIGSRKRGLGGNTTNHTTKPNPTVRAMGEKRPLKVELMATKTEPQTAPTLGLKEAVEAINHWVNYHQDDISLSIKENGHLIAIVQYGD